MASELQVVTRPTCIVNQLTVTEHCTPGQGNVVLCGDCTHATVCNFILCKIILL